MNKKRTNLPMPHINVPTIENPDYIKKYAKSDKMKYAYEKHIKPSIKRDQKRKQSIKKEWLINHLFDISALIVSVIALLKSYEVEIFNLIAWIKQLLEQQ